MESVHLVDLVSMYEERILQLGLNSLTRRNPLLFINLIQKRSSNPKLVKCLLTYCDYVLKKLMLLLMTVMYARLKIKLVVLCAFWEQDQDNTTLSKPDLPT